MVLRVQKFKKHWPILELHITLDTFGDKPQISTSKVFTSAVAESNFISTKYTKMDNTNSNNNNNSIGQQENVITVIIRLPLHNLWPWSRCPSNGCVSVSSFCIIHCRSLCVIYFAAVSKTSLFTFISPFSEVFVNFFRLVVNVESLKHVYELVNVNK